MYLQWSWNVTFCIPSWDPPTFLNNFFLIFTHFHMIFVQYILMDSDKCMSCIQTEQHHTDSFTFLPYFLFFIYQHPDSTNQNSWKLLICLLFSMVFIFSRMSYKQTHAVCSFLRLPFFFFKQKHAFKTHLYHCLVVQFNSLYD